MKKLPKKNQRPYFEKDGTLFEREYLSWETLGHASVDSGQLLLIDPAYLSRWEQKAFEDIRIYQHKQTGKTLQYGVDFQMYSDPLPQYDGKDMNELNRTGEWSRLPVPQDTGLNYNAVSHTTLSPTRGGGVDLGVAFATGWGDGHYPVQVRRNSEGRIMQVLIDFDDDSDQLVAINQSLVKPRKQ